MRTDTLLDRIDITSSELDENGEVLLSLGDVKQKEDADKEQAVRVRAWGIDGFQSRPNDPDDDGAAHALFAYDGWEKRVLGTRDRRWLSYVGSLQPGDRAIVSNTEARFMLKQATDTVSLYTVNQDTDNSMLLSLDGSAGQISLVNGNACITIKDDEILLAVNGGGAIHITKDGVTIAGGVFTAAAGTVALGANAAVPVLSGSPPGKPSLSVFVPAA